MSERFWGGSLQTQELCIQGEQLELKINNHTDVPSGDWKSCDWFSLGCWRFLTQASDGWRNLKTKMINAKPKYVPLSTAVNYEAFVRSKVARTPAEYEEGVVKSWKWILLKHTLCSMLDHRPPWTMNAVIYQRQTCTVKTDQVCSWLSMSQNNKALCCPTRIRK